MIRMAFLRYSNVIVGSPGFNVNRSAAASFMITFKESRFTLSANHARLFNVIPVVFISGETVVVAISSDSPGLFTRNSAMVNEAGDKYNHPACCFGNTYYLSAF